MFKDGKMKPKVKRNIMLGLKAGKLISDTLGTNPNPTPDNSELPEIPAKYQGPEGEKKEEGEKDSGGGSEQVYNSDTGTLGKPEKRKAYGNSAFRS